MSVSMVALAADLGSFNNMSVDDSLNALRSGLSGETEPLKRFGVSLNDTILRAKALELGFGKIVGVMDPAIKSQVIYATVLEQTRKAQGDYARTAEGTANTMKTLSARFDDSKVAIGEALMPAFRALLKLLEVFIPVIEAIGRFFTENAEALKNYASIVLTAVAAFKVYRGVVITTTAVSALYTAVLAAQARGFTIAQIAAFNFKLALQLINAAIRANPIGAIITLVVLLGAAFVIAWKKSETFREVVTKAMQMVLKAFAKVAEYAGKFFNMLGKIPGMGWAKTIGNGLDGISDKLTATSNKLSLLLTDALNIAAKQDAAMAGRGPSFSAGETTEGGDKTSAASLEKLTKYKTDVKKIYKDIKEVIADAYADALKAAIERDEKIAEAHASYDESIADATKRSFEADFEANKRYNEQIIDINKDYAKRTLDLEKNITKKIADLKASAVQKSLDLTKQAADKQDGILKQSMDRLRSAFASKTGFSLQESFASGKSTDSLLNDLKAKLEAAKDLQANAAMLAGMGYSQTFIEEVVKNGPEAGNEIAKALKDASPEATKQLQTLYAQVDTISNHGMDELAATMNAGGRLATDELRSAYSQVAVDLKKSLTEVDTQLQESLADANAAYMDAMAEAKINRDERIIEADTQLIEALTKSKKALDEATADAQATLTKTLAEVQKNYEKQIDDINTATIKKLKDLKDKLKEVAKAMAELGASQAAAAAMANRPVYTPTIPSVVNSGSSSGGSAYNPLTGMTVVNNVTGVNMSSPQLIVESVLSGVKYGTAVIAPKSNFSYGSGNPLAKVT